MRDRKYPMNLARLFNHCAYCRSVIESVDSIDQIDTAINLCAVYLAREEMENDVEERPLWKDNLIFALRFRMRERKNYLDILQVIGDELQSALTEKIEELQESGGVLPSNSDYNKGDKIGFRFDNQQKKEKSVGFRK